MSVQDSSPAARAGLEEGNRIAAINGVNLRVAHEDADDPNLGSTKAQRLMREVPAGSALRYVCAIAYVDASGAQERVFEAYCSGRRADTARGQRGFGYDPCFVPDDGPGGLTMAELTDEQKDAISHRGRAARALRDWLTGG